MDGDEAMASADQFPISYLPFVRCPDKMVLKRI